MSPTKVLSALSRVLFGIAVSLTLAQGAEAQNQFKVLYSFTNGTDGGGVWDSLVFDKQGNIYGTTSGGGAYGYGTVFELTPNGDGTWSESVLHSFMNNDPDGDEPFGSLVLDANGNLYGTAEQGGSYIYDGGAVFELTPGSGGWSLTALHSFGGSADDGFQPYAGLTFDGTGNLYGTTSGGGVYSGGAVFELTLGGAGDRTESVLYSLGTHSNDGMGSYAG